MPDDNEVPKYTRQSLRKATRFSEGDYKGINPREFYRRLKRRLEEVQTENDFKYQTRGNQRSDLNIISEEVGEKTGRIEGRLMGESDWVLLGTGKLDYKPYGSYGALSVVVSLLFGFFAALAQSTFLIVLSVLGIVGGLYLYFQTESGEFPVARKDVIRVLATGEVSERTIEDTDEERTDIFANISVIYAGDSFVNVLFSTIDPQYADRVTEFEDLNWHLRWEIVNQVKRWANDIIDDEDEEFEIDDGFTGRLSAVFSHSVSDDRDQIAEVQSKMNSDFDDRLEYTDKLLNELGSGVRSDIDQQKEEISRELEELAEDMDVYVDREGLEHTS